MKIMNTEIDNNFIIIAVILLVFFFFTFKKIEHFTNEDKQKVLNCASQGNYWIGQCIPPNASNIKCVLNGKSWVNGSCVSSKSGQTLENALLCAENKDIYMNNKCFNRNKMSCTQK